MPGWKYGTWSPNAGGNGFATVSGGDVRADGVTTHVSVHGGRFPDRTIHTAEASDAAARRDLRASTQSNKHPGIAIPLETPNVSLLNAHPLARYVDPNVRAKVEAYQTNEVKREKLKKLGAREGSPRWNDMLASMGGFAPRPSNSTLDAWASGVSSVAGARYMHDAASGESYGMMVTTVTEALLYLDIDRKERIMDGDKAIATLERSVSEIRAAVVDPKVKARTLRAVEHLGRDILMTKGARMKPDHRARLEHALGVGAPVWTILQDPEVKAMCRWHELGKRPKDLMWLSIIEKHPADQPITVAVVDQIMESSAFVPPRPGYSATPGVKALLGMLNADIERFEPDAHAKLAAFVAARYQPEYVEGAFREVIRRACSTLLDRDDYLDLPERRQKQPQRGRRVV